MTLPNFLGIGAMRSGTSWLYEQLRAHKDIYMSEQKELYFFNNFYDHGIDWYAGHFPSAKAAVNYKAIGEITPTYMANPDTAARIHAHLPNSRFLVMLRNPVDRAISEYTKRLRDYNFKGTFDDAVKRSNGVLDRGCYTEQLERYFRFFPRDRFLILIFEEAVSNHQATIQKLAAFLEVDPHGFDLNRMKQKVNPSYLPRLPGLYSSTVKVKRYLQRKDLGRILTTAEKLGLHQAARSVFRFRGPRAQLPELDEKARNRLADLYAPEIRSLEELLDMDLSIWRSQPQSSDLNLLKRPAL